MECEDVVSANSPSWPANEEVQNGCSWSIRVELDYHPQGKRKRGQPKNTWRRSRLQELEGVGYTWERAKRVAKNKEPGALEDTD